MNENQKQNINENEKVDDNQQDTMPVDDGNNGNEKPEPPTFDGKDDDDSEKPEPPTFDGQDDADSEKPEPPTFDGQADSDDTNDVNKTSTTSTADSTFSSSSIFGLVKSMFTSITSQFNFSFNFGNFFNAPMQNFRQFMFGGFHQPQPPMPTQPMRGGFSPVQTFFGTQTQFAYSTSSSTVMTLDSTGDKEVWLNENSEEVTIDATSTTGSNVLAGNNKDNQIFGGYGHNEMWGGSYKTNDYLFGGTGQNTFWYGKGEGIDLVENTKKGDTINLYNITIGDISNVEITDSSISIVVGEEGVAVNSSDEVSPTFKLSNGESYNYNRSSAEWQKA